MCATVCVHVCVCVRACMCVCMLTNGIRHTTTKNDDQTCMSRHTQHHTQRHAFDVATYTTGPAQLFTQLGVFFRFSPLRLLTIRERSRLKHCLLPNSLTMSSPARLLKHHQIKEECGPNRCVFPPVHFLTKKERSVGRTLTAERRAAQAGGGHMLVGAAETAVSC